MDVSCSVALQAMCSRLFIEMAVSKIRVVDFEVRKPDGTIVGVFQIHSRHHVANLRHEIAVRTDACKCSFTLMIDHKFPRDCRSISNLAPQQSHVVVIMLPHSP